MRGKFITLEGMDGAGKSTHIPTIIAGLQAKGLEVVSTREPGGTPLGEALRELLLHQAMHAETETLLMFAARREHIAQVIEPALARGAYVVSDRFSDASFAYQSGGRGVAATKIEQLESWVHPDSAAGSDYTVRCAGGGQRGTPRVCAQSGQVRASGRSILQPHP